MADYVLMVTSSGLFCIVQIPKFKCEHISRSEPSFQKDDYFSNVELNKVTVILIYLSPTKNIWVLLRKLMAGRGFCFYGVGVQFKCCRIYQSDL